MPPDSAPDLDAYWRATRDSYPHYPTVRHRRRFVCAALRRAGVGPAATVFDYGCGTGGILTEIGRRLGVPPDRLAGYDPSVIAIDTARQAGVSPHLYARLADVPPGHFDAVVCSEVLEHTPDYRDILCWCRDRLRPGGVLVLTTQAGPVHASDRYTGHTQHFDRTGLAALVRGAGLDVLSARSWGFPLFTVQKYLTDLAFARVRRSYLDGGMSPRRRLVFALAYLAFFAHDLIPAGPQLYLTGRRPG